MILFSLLVSWYWVIKVWDPSALYGIWYVSFFILRVLLLLDKLAFRRAIILQSRILCVTCKLMLFNLNRFRHLTCFLRFIIHFVGLSNRWGNIILLCRLRIVLKFRRTLVQLLWLVLRIKILLRWISIYKLVCLLWWNNNFLCWILNYGDLYWLSGCNKIIILCFVYLFFLIYSKFLRRRLLL